MKTKQKIYKNLSMKLCINVLSISLLSLMMLPLQADNLSAISGAIDADMKTFLSKPKDKAKGIPDDIQTAVEKKLISSIEIEKVKTDDEALQIFRAPIYYVKPKLGYIAVVDGEVLDLNKASSNARLPGYLKLIKDEFILDSEEKASQLVNAFHKAYPYKFKKIVKPVKVKHGWVAPLGKFFKNYSGLIFSTNDKGKITLVEFSLSINPDYFSYKPIPE